MEKDIERIINSTAEATISQTREKLDLLIAEQEIVAKSIQQKQALIDNQVQEEKNIKQNINAYSSLIDEQESAINKTKDEIEAAEAVLMRRAEFRDVNKESKKAYKEQFKAVSELNKKLYAQELQLKKSNIAVEELQETLNTPMNPEEVEKLKERYKALGFAVEDVTEALANQLGEANRLDLLGENLTSALETVEGFLAAEVEATQAAAQAKMDAYDEEANAKIDSLKKSRKFQKKSDARQQKEIDAIKKEAEKKKEAERAKANKQAAIQFRINQILAIRDAVMNTSVGYAKALAQGGFVLGIPMAAAVAALGAVQVASIAAQKPPKMEQGGMIGGRRHAQGGTMIEAEQGEFVMNRNAVEAIGAENLNRMNRGGGAGANITFSGNVMSDDFIQSEAIPKIKEAIRRGEDIGVS